MSVSSTTNSLKISLPPAALQAISRGIERGDCVVEMEILGVPQRMINALEYSEYKIVKLEDLVNRRLDDLMTIDNVGVTAINQLINALSRYDELEKILENDTL
jgi:hypothetical protein